MKYLKSLITLSLISALAGCSPESQDSVDDNQVPVIAKGAVIDPFISSAIIFADYDDDDVLDSFEPWAFTDIDGYYSLSKSGTDYCSNNSRFCLKLPSADPVKLVAVGGYDSTTFERVNSRLSGMYDGSMLYITPLTSVGDMSLNEQNTIERNQNILLNAFSSEDSAFGLAFNVHKVVELISRAIEDEYPLIGDDKDLPVDVTGFVYKAINKIGKDEQVSLATFLTQLTDGQIEKILIDVRTKLDVLVLKQGSSNFAKTIIKQRSLQAKNANELGDRVRGLSLSLKTLHNLLTTQLSQDFTESKIRMLQVMANNAMGFSAPQAQTVSDILETLTTDDAFFSHLQKDSFDAHYFENLTSMASVDAGKVRMDNRLAIPTSIINMQLVLKDKSEKRDAVIGFFFDGNIDANSNGKDGETVTACVKFQNLKKPSDSQNTNGTVLTGHWDRTNYIIDLTLTLGGTEEALRIKTTDSSSFRFDYDKTEKNWSTVSSFTATTIDVPTTNEQCKTWIAGL